MSYLGYANPFYHLTDNPALLHRVVMDYGHTRSDLAPLTPPPVSECLGQAAYSWSPKDVA